MKQFFQIRGCMGSGKTTIARQIVQSGEFVVDFIDIFGKKYPYTRSKDGKIVVTGRYDIVSRKCGGLDGTIKNKEIMKEYVIALLKMSPSPQIIIFEAVMYGVTFKFSYELANNCKKFGYSYKAYALFPSFDVLLNRLYERNGGRQIKVESILKQYNRGLDSSKKLVANGIDVEFIDTAKVPLEEMHKIITKDFYHE